ncbi:type II secretion system F family protein [Aestuariicoccus sp. MJ-SS9]|uniref:type II secretion system F family protein n=1 Tax=Aestuariicoccus sp. MJ-SS9 TaxID=3079855 RepID=UPI00291495C2|nr:type II secretion system F family protein [Aestuariicoccus sp. MJ-SS9]MDU8912188.1 type II secretion system F family protein [Aestuariicoccus sp. MJ-SS9]
MRAFGYTAYTDDGKTRRGTIVAETEAEAARSLKAQGLFVSDLADKGAAEARRRLTLVPRGRLNADMQAVLTRQLAVLLAADLPGEAALEAIRAGGAGAAVDAVAARARAGLLEGAALSDALAASGAGFPPFYIAAIRAGETSGDVAVVMGELADHLETAGTQKAEIAAALVYPAFVAAVSLLVCGILMTSVAPQIVEMFALSGRPLPGITQVVLGISNWIQGHAVPLGAGAAALVLLGLMSGRLAPLRAARDRLALRLPVVGGLMRRAAAVQYLRTLALVLGSRHAVLSGVDSAREVLGPARFRAEAAEVAEAVRGGESLSGALTRASFIPPVARQLVDAGEMSARLARMTERAALLVENNLTAERRRIAALLEPILMMLVGAMVLVIVLAVLLPIFDLQSVVAG